MVEVTEVQVVRRSMKKRHLTQGVRNHCHDAATARLGLLLHLQDALIILQACKHVIRENGPQGLCDVVEVSDQGHHQISQVIFLTQLLQKPLLHPHHQLQGPRTLTFSSHHPLNDQGLDEILSEQGLTLLFCDLQLAQLWRVRTQHVAFLLLLLKPWGQILSANLDDLLLQVEPEDASQGSSGLL